MGLDMYLRKKVYVGANWEHNKVTGDITIFSKGERIKVDLSKVVSIYEEAITWRKANAIHKWFVDNIQNGEDDCGEYYVEYDSLQILKHACEEAIENKDSDVLQPTSGFFFGSTEKDEYYYDTLHYTVSLLNKLDPQGSYYYSSSW